jgi:hypothetical protein
MSKQVSAKVAWFVRQKNVKTKPTTVICLSSLFQKNTIEQSKKVLLLSLTFGRHFSVTKKKTLNYDLLKLSHMDDKIVVKFIYNLSVLSCQK